jgi:hypothetical protein
MMEKFAVNYNNLEQDLEPKAQVYRYEDVKHRIKKVAFDVVRFTDGDDISGLWQVQQTDDGDVIVAKYDDSYMEATKEASSDWQALADRSGENVNIFYKNSPVTKVSLASVGIPNIDADIVCRRLPECLTSNKTLVSGLLAELSSSDRKELLNAHPELDY